MARLISLVVGAGFVSGVVFHPTAKDVRYARTDMGGAYRWDAKAGRWAPMLNWVSYADLNLMGVESIAIDPKNPKVVYLACGTYTAPDVPDGAILRSADGGKTFSVTRVPIKFGGNENGRGNGERLTVDPTKPRRLLLGTRKSGLWRSDNAGANWRRVESFPATGGARGAGLIATILRGKEAYVAVSDAEGPTLYRSTDDGATWSEVPNAPRGLFPTHMVRGDDETLWITYGSSPGPTGMTSGAVWKLKGDRWTDVTPDRPDAQRRFGYVGVAVQPGKPGTAIVSSFYRPGGEQIFRTTDGGRTWKPIIGGKETYDHSAAPYQARTGIHWLFDLEIDPMNPDHATFTTGYGGHETYNLTDADRGAPVRWQALAPGIEESVPLALLSPTRGVPLVVGIGDYGGGTFADLDRPLPEGNFTNPHFGNTDSIAAGDLAPETIVRVGAPTGFDVRVGIGVSRDGGRSWNPTGVPVANARNGHIAVSADGRTWIWSLRGGIYRTTDGGVSWTPVQGLLSGQGNASRAVADRIDPNRFYALDLFGGKLYESTDAGFSFTARALTLPDELPRPGGDRGDSRGGQDQVYATPGRSGDLWIAAANGLYHSADRQSWSRMPGVEVVHGFGFGKGVAGVHEPALYLVGTVRGQRGVFRSDTFGTSWVRINDDAHQWGLVLLVTGDPKVYGRVYVGTHGRGAFCGDPLPSSRR